MNRELLKQALDALENDAMQRTFAGGVRIGNAAIALRAALAEPAAPQGEPVAWRVRGYAQFKTGSPGPWRYFDGAGKPAVNNPDGCDFESLYAAPPAASSVPAAQWIACSEQLPDADIEVLAWVVGEPFWDGHCWIATYDGHGWNADEGRYALRGVTHWMDLPGEPSGEGAK